MVATSPLTAKMDFQDAAAGETATSASQRHIDICFIIIIFTAASKEKEAATAKLGSFLLVFQFQQDSLSGGKDWKGAKFC